MITLEQQQKLFLDIGKQIQQPVSAYAIGGTSMMFQGLKDNTLDIDLVFESTSDKNVFQKAAEKLDFRPRDSILVYGARSNIPVMLTLGDVRLDLFVVKIINFVFSDAMRSRAKQRIHKFGNLTIHAADPHDLIILKCATDRDKDKDDVRSIIQKARLDWNTIVEEAKNQIKLGEGRAVFELGCFLEDLKEKMKQPVPNSVLDGLYEILKKQIEQKQRKTDPTGKIKSDEQRS